MLDFDQFLERKRVTSAEQAHISVGTSPDFTSPVLLIPCAAESPQGLALTLDPRYDRYDLGKFYAQHIRQNDLAVCIQHKDRLERYLLTIRRSLHMMKSIEVVAAVIFDEQGRIFATQRGYG